MSMVSNFSDRGKKHYASCFQSVSRVRSLTFSLSFCSSGLFKGSVSGFVDGGNDLQSCRFEALLQ